MSKLACTCGHVIFDQAASLPCKAHLLADPMSILAPLPTPGPHARMEHPLLGLACAAVAVVLVVAFARGYAAANPPETAEAIRRGDAKPVWTRAMWLQILGAFALMGLMMAVG